jgi:hypothetical protein
MIRGVAGFSIPTKIPLLIWTPPTTTETTPTSSFSDIQSYLKLEIIILVLLFIVLLILSVYIYRIKTTRNSKVQIHFCSGTEEVSFTLATVPAPPFSLALSSTKCLPKIIEIKQVHRIFRKEIRLEWSQPKFSLINQITDTSFEIPTFFIVSKLKAHKLKCIIANDYMIFLSIMHGNVHYTVKEFQETACNTSPTRKLTEATPMRLYPQI